MLKTIKNILFRRFVRSKPYTDKHNRKTTNWESIKTMGFLLDGSDPVALRLLLNKLYAYEQQGKKVFFLGYVNKLPPFQDENIKWITKKDLSWVGIPKMQSVKHFLEQDFDVLFNTSLKSMRPLEFISTYSKANLRIGLYNEKKTYCYDFMLRLLPGETVYDFLHQAEYYLKMLKN